MTSTISLNIEISEDLYNEFQRHLDRSSDWDQDRTMTAALSLFLMQRSVSPIAGREYMNATFAAEAA